MAKGGRLKILVFAVHPDDEVLGAGGTLLKAKSEGHDIFICYCTKGSGSDYSAKILGEKRAEAEKAARMLGAKETFFLDFTAGALNTVPAAELSKKIGAVVSGVGPDAVFLPHKGDLHTDHQAVFNAGMVASRPNSGFTVARVLCYETSSETEWSEQYKRRFVPNVYVPIGNFLKQKLRVLAVYRTELRKYPHPRSLKAVGLKARQRGSEVVENAAEAFMLVRQIGLR